LDDKSFNILKQDRNKGIKVIYELYAHRLFAYSKLKWKLDQDVSWDLIYKTIYRVADTIERYDFMSEEKFAAFIFTCYINSIRDYKKSADHISKQEIEVEMSDKVIDRAEDTLSTPSNNNVSILNEELEKFEDWEKVLLLLRGQNMPYASISEYVGKPENQLKVYYSRLKKALERNLGNRLNRINDGAKEK
jgi:RNA polymerase sigma factor (sigma-70 family)